MKLKSKLLIVFVEVAILPIIIIAFVSFTNSRVALRTSTLQQLNSVASLQEQRVEDILDRNRERLNLFVNRPALVTLLSRHREAPASDTKAQLDTIIAQTIEANSVFKTISVALPDGEVLASSDARQVGTNVRTNEYFVEGKDNPVTTSLVFENGTYLFKLASPIKSNDGLQAVVLMDVSASNLIAALTDYTGLGDTGQTLLVDRVNESKAVVISPVRNQRNEQQELIQLNQEESPFTMVLAGEEGEFTGIDEREGTPVLAATRYIDIADWGLITEVSREEAYQPINALRNLLIFFTLATLIIVLAIAFTVAHAISWPISRLTEMTGAVARGNLRKKITIHTRDEIGLLAASFNTMTKQLRGLYGSLESQVTQKTTELQQLLRDTEEKNRNLEKTKSAMLNLFEDLEHEKLAAQEQQAKSEAILKSIGDGVFAVDNNGTVILFNKAAEEVTGYSRTYAVGKHINDVLKFQLEEGGKASNEFIQEALAGKKATMSRRTLIKHKNGALIAVEDSAAPIIDKKGATIGAIVVFRDVSKDRDLQRAKDEFVGLASHQLRTPATAVKNFIGLIKEGYAGDLSEEQEQYIQLAYESNERQLDIVNDLLYVARTDSGQLVMKKARGDIVELVNAAVREQSGTLQDRNQSVQIKTSNDAVYASYDHEHIHMVIENLISNASKYTPNGGSITITVKENKAKVTVGISDTGVGIAKTDLDKLFRKFSRIDNKMSHVAGGSGIGLYLAKQIMDLHQGRITVQSDIGKGSTFTVELPKKS